jgi:hypothetical protein
MESIGFFEALKVRGVLQYGIAFFCVKFSVYAFLLWVPMFLKTINYEG